MKHVFKPLLLLPFVFLLTACNEKNETDQEKPTIDINYAQAYPKNCDTLYIGIENEIFLRVSDNVALGSINIEIHNNFDHHSHSTEAFECSTWPIKDPVNPFKYNYSNELPVGATETNINITIAIPTGVDEGDYHITYSLTDKVGWQKIKILSVKILEQ